jgi:hypothetical protein
MFNISLLDLTRNNLEAVISYEIFSEIFMTVLSWNKEMIHKESQWRSLA